VFLRQHLFEHADHIQEHVLFRGGLLTALCVAACRQRRRVRFTTAAALVNKLVEAKHQLQLTEEPLSIANRSVLSDVHDEGGIADRYVVGCVK